MKTCTILVPKQSAIDGNVLAGLSSEKDAFSEFVKNHIAITRLSHNSSGIMVTEGSSVLKYDQKAHTILVDDMIINVGEESEVSGGDSKIYLSHINSFIPNY